MPNTVSQSHFAKMCGVSRQAISKAKNEKPPAIKLYGKHVNLDHRITCEYFFTHTGKNLRPESVDDVPPVKAKVKPKPKPKPPRRPPAARKLGRAAPAAAEKIGRATPSKSVPVEKITAPIEDDQDYDLDDSVTLPDGILTLDDINETNILTIQTDYLKKLKELENAKSSKQKREEALGLLIKRSTVRAVFAKLHTIDTNQWKTLEDRLAPGISGIFGFEEGCKEEVEVRKVINEEAAKTLRFVKRLFDDFLVKNKEVPL